MSFEIGQEVLLIAERFRKSGWGRSGIGQVLKDSGEIVIVRWEEELDSFYMEGGFEPDDLCLAWEL